MDGGDEEHRALEELLGAYALGALEEPQRRSVEAHLQHCDACARELAQLREAVELLPEAPEPSGELWQRIVAKVRRHRGGSEGPAP